MNICGIVAEYNPFHNGHAYQIAQTRLLLGKDTAIAAVMSANWVQRGEPALMPKHLRAKAAVLSGADLVLELPAAHALQSAEGFARQAVSRLCALGNLTHLSFGAECGDLETLRTVAGLLLEHETVAQTLTQLKTGVSYAAAREKALYQRIQEKSQIISHPNNILAVEYLKALRALESNIQPIVIPRRGAGHDSRVATEDIASASYIRDLVRQGKLQDALAFLPLSAREMMKNVPAGGQLLCEHTLLEAAFAASFARLTVEDLARLPDIAEGLEYRLYHALRSCRGFEKIAAAAKTKRYALSRIRRLLCCAFLGITRLDAGQTPQYLRVLAMNDRGRQVLAAARKTARLPVITKPAHSKRLSQHAQEQFRLEALASDLYHTALGDVHSPPGSDWRRDAVYLQQPGQ